MWNVATVKHSNPEPTENKIRTLCVLECDAVYSGRSLPTLRGGGGRWLNLHGRRLRQEGEKTKQQTVMERKDNPQLRSSQYWQGPLKGGAILLPLTWRRQDTPKRRYTNIRPYCVASQMIFNIIAIRTSIFAHESHVRPIIFHKALMQVNKNQAFHTQSR